MQSTTREPVPAALNRRAAATYLGIGLSKLDEITTTGDLRHVRIGRCIRYRRAALDRFLEKQERAGTAG